VPQLLGTLSGSVFPDQRESAALALGQVDPLTHRHVVHAVLTAAHDDSAPIVRVACIRCLMQMKANTLAVRSTLTDLANDSDPRVRHEADEALGQLMGGPPDLLKAAPPPASSGSSEGSVPR
jgi:HEAT repeat protein